MITARGYAAHEAGGALAPYTFTRRDPGPRDVVLRLSHCGVCHSDVDAVRGTWNAGTFPMVPGHEIVGHVVETGAEVSLLAVGDRAAVGCMVDSCGNCANCQAGAEHTCAHRPTMTYGGKERSTGLPTHGGYSDILVVNERFAVRLPTSLDSAAAAPLLCAGITTYSPLRHWQVGPGQEVGVVGLGGLGHLAVKFAKAMGARVVLFTTSADKTDDAHRLGADEVVLSTSAQAMAAQAGRLHFVLDTVSAGHDVDVYLNTLRRDGTLCLLGVVIEPVPVSAMSLVRARRRLAGSMIGGLRETQEMLDFCAEHAIAADIEPIAVDQINDAYERVVNGRVRYRFVIDLATLGPDSP